MVSGLRLYIIFQLLAKPIIIIPAGFRFRPHTPRRKRTERCTRITNEAFFRAENAFLCNRKKCSRVHINDANLLQCLGWRVSLGGETVRLAIFHRLRYIFDEF